MKRMHILVWNLLCNLPKTFLLLLNILHFLRKITFLRRKITLWTFTQTSTILLCQLPFDKLSADLIVSLAEIENAEICIIYLGLELTPTQVRRSKLGKEG